MGRYTNKQTSRIISGRMSDNSTNTGKIQGLHYANYNKGSSLRLPFSQIKAFCTPREALGYQQYATVNKHAVKNESTEEIQ